MRSPRGAGTGRPKGSGTIRRVALSDGYAYTVHLPQREGRTAAYVGRFETRSAAEAALGLALRATTAAGE